MTVPHNAPAGQKANRVAGSKMMDRRLKYLRKELDLEATIMQIIKQSRSDGTCRSNGMRKLSCQSVHGTRRQMKSTHGEDTSYDKRSVREAEPVTGCIRRGVENSCLSTAMLYSNRKRGLQTDWLTSF